jgi:glucose uptake protein
MLIPSTYTIALLAMILSMLCWGSWANTLKLAGPKWRFELFYFDYSFGVLVASVIAAFTLGSFGDGFSFIDNLTTAGKTNIVYALAAGVVFNLANMLLVAAITIAGLAVAFPIGIGLALVIGVIWNYILNPQGNVMLLAGGSLLVVVAIIVDARAYSAIALIRRLPAPAPAEPEVITTRHGKRVVKRPSAPRARGGAKGIALSLISGVLMGSFYPLVTRSMEGEIVGLGAYSVAFVFAVGVFFSTLVYNLYFMNLPVEGDPIPLRAYFKGTGKMHLLGVLGGIVWCMGAIANFAAASTPKTVQVGPAVSYAIGQGATMISALWGLFVWKEFAGADGKVRLLIGLMLLFFVAGLLLLSLAPLYA